MQPTGKVQYGIKMKAQELPLQKRPDLLIYIARDASALKVFLNLPMYLYFLLEYKLNTTLSQEEDSE